MADVFLKIVNMSISASWLVLAVLVFRLVFKKAPKWIHVLLWGIVAVRLLCPFSIESALSLIPSAETISPEIMMSQEPTIHTGVPAINSVVNPLITETFAPEPVASANPLQILIPVLAMIWGIGVALLLAYTAISYWRLRRRVRMAVLLRDNIYQSEAVSSPFVLGIIKPKIYLPFQIDGQNLEHVVSHEQAHIRRRDHWWKPLGFLLLTIHWFNPLMWLAYVLLCRDIEFACDEKVVKELGKDQRADYSQALLACSVNRRMIAACPLAFGEVGVKERVKSVLNYKKPAFWVIVVSAIACAVVAVCFLTNPSDDNHAPEPFSHSYRVKKIMYQDTRYSFGYTMDTAPQYQLTSDYQLFVSGDAFDGAGAGEWVQHRGAFKEVKLSELRFADYFKDPGNLSGWDGARYGADSIREQTKQAWRLEVDDVENGVFYYLILTHTDNVFLCYGYNVGDTDAAAEEDSLIRWVFELERTDLLTCNVISEGLDAFVELACFPDTDIDRDTDNWPVAKINESGTLRFSLEDDANTLVVSEDYYRKSEDSTFIERNTFEIARNDDGFFAIDIARRESLEDHVNYFIKIKGQSDVYAMKVVFDAASIDGEPKPAQLGGSQTLSLNDVIMLSQKGRDLTWSDFEQFKYIETGSGLYIRVYEINEMYQLWIGGAGPDSDPMYIYLALADDLDTRINIRDGGVTEFIGADHSEVLLAKAINEAILAENKPSKPDGLYHCASFVLLDQQELSGSPAVGSSDHTKLVTAYGLALHQGFGFSGHTFHDAAGSHIAVAITFEVVDGKYVLKEYWTPRDGSYYVQDIRDKFPDEVEDEALDTQKYILAQKQACYEQGVRYGGVDTNYAVEYLFEVIESSPAHSSRPGDYINEHPVEYRELTYYGEYTLFEGLRSQNTQ